MSQLDASEESSDADWLWHGLVARGMVTLLTSRAKSGKTTLLTGLLQQMANGGSFLDRPVSAAKALYVSEESKKRWAVRQQRMRIGEHCELLARPFPRRPTAEQWDQLVELGMEMQAAGKLDLLVIDSLTRFLPGSGDVDLNGVYQMLDPLQLLTESGAGVVLVHHPRKRWSEEGMTARGHSALLAAVDVIVEQNYYGTLRSDECRRTLFAVSRMPETPRRLVYEWDPTTARFRYLADALGVRFNENWGHVQAILKKRKSAATHEELLVDWPADLERPSARTLYEWLNRAFEGKLVRRSGSGRRSDPYRYRLENEDDEYYDRGELPPIRDMNLREIFRD